MHRRVIQGAMLAIALAVIMIYAATSGPEAAIAVVALEALLAAIVVVVVGR